MAKMGSLFPDDQQSQVGNDIEDQPDDLEQSEERVSDDVDGIAGDRKQFALHGVHKIRGQHEYRGREHQQGSVYDRTPQEKLR